MNVIMFLGKPAIDITVVHTTVSEKDKLLFLGPWRLGEPENFIYIDGNPTWEDIAVMVGVFPSKSQARKNGWVGIVGSGFHQRAIGQNDKRKCITVLNFLEEDEDNDAT
jgi:hypothetical protein